MKTTSYVSTLEEKLALEAALRHLDQSTEAGRVMAKLIKCKLAILKLAKF